MGKSVTIQDIADALGMSRNTVSKALNGKHVPLKTRNAVISTAIEMGYKGYHLAAKPNDIDNLQKRFLILSSRLLMNINYYIYVLRGIEEALTDHDIELIQFNVTNASSFAKLNNYLLENTIDGIICIEFFEPSYIKQLINLDIPLVFLDYPFCSIPSSGHFDIVLPESRDALMNYCLELIQDKQCKTFGFVGDYLHCYSFYERYSGVREAMFLSGYPYNSNFSILHDDTKSYSSEDLLEQLRAMPELPDCFVAANDTIANNILEALSSLKKRIPEEVKVIGFDNIPEAKAFYPPLTTFNVNKAAMGKQITSILLDRIENPSKPNSIIYIMSKLIVRAST